MTGTRDVRPESALRQELARRDDLDAAVLAQLEEEPVDGDEVLGAGFDRALEVAVVAWVFRDDAEPELARADHGLDRAAVARTAFTARATSRSMVAALVRRFRRWASATMPKNRARRARHSSSCQTGTTAAIGRPLRQADLVSAW